MPQCRIWGSSTGNACEGGTHTSKGHHRGKREKSVVPQLLQVSARFILSESRNTTKTVIWMGPIGGLVGIWWIVLQRYYRQAILRWILITSSKRITYGWWRSIDIKRLNPNFLLAHYQFLQNFSSFYIAEVPGKKNKILSDLFLFRMMLKVIRNRPEMSNARACQHIGFLFSWALSRCKIELDREVIQQVDIWANKKLWLSFNSDAASPSLRKFLCGL